MHAGLATDVLPLQQLFPGYQELYDGGALTDLLYARRASVLIISSDHFIASRSTSGLFGIDAISKRYKAMFPEACVGVSGRLASVLGSALLARCPCVDFLTLGAVDEVLASIATLAADEGIAGLSLHPNVVTRSCAQKEEFAAQAPLQPVGQTAFRLARNAIAIYRQLSGREGKTPFSLRSSAGCTYRCQFCAAGVHWSNYKTKRADVFADEVAAFKEELGDLAYLSFLEDELFTLNEEHVTTTCAVLRANAVLLDGAYTTAGLLDSSRAEAMSGATRTVRIGLEGIGQRPKARHKKVTLDAVFEASAVCAKYNIGLCVDDIVGLPTDTRASIFSRILTIYALMQAGVVQDAETYVFCPHPGTAFGDKPGEFGISIEGAWEVMNESGGFPTARTKALDTAAVFQLYLLSQVIISDCRRTGPVPAARQARRNLTLMGSLLGLTLS